MIDYRKENWIDVLDPKNPENGAIPITAEKLDKIEQGIIDTNDDLNKRITDECLPKTGGTMTGSLILNGTYKNDNEAVDKKYVDNFQPPWYVEDEKGVAVPLKCLSISPVCEYVSASGREDEKNEDATYKGELFTAINSGTVWLQFRVYRKSSSAGGYFSLFLNDTLIYKEVFDSSVSSSGKELSYKMKISLNKGDIVYAECHVVPSSTSYTGYTSVRDAYLFANIDTPFCYALSEEDKLQENSILIEQIP